MDGYEKAIKKIEHDKKCKPLYCPRPTGPTGVTGPTGPTGATGNTPLINSILVDNDGTQAVSSRSLVNLGTLINSTGTTLTYTSPNTVNLEPGTYYILYEVLISNTSTAGDIGASLLLNGESVNNASEYIPSNSIQNQIVLQHNVTITENSIIQVKNNSNVSNNYHDSSLSILRLG